MSRPIKMLVLAAVVALQSRTVCASDEPDESMTGKMLVIQTAKAFKFSAKPLHGQVFDLPNVPDNDPRIEGATLRVFDTLSTDRDLTINLPPNLAPLGWTGLGNPPGSKGFRYKGTASLTNPCVTVIVRSRGIRATCRGIGINLLPPFFGDAGVILTVGTASKRYCVTFGGTVVKNESGFLKRLKAGTALPCPPPPTSNTTTTSTTTETTTTDTTTTTTTTIPPDCGNGLLDPGEDCDPPLSFTCPDPGSPMGAFLPCNPDCTCGP